MSCETNKDAVRRFNLQVIERGDRAAFDQLMAPAFTNRSAPEGVPNGSESMWHTFQNVLRPALSDLKVTIHDQLAEGDRVATRKTIRGVHTGTLLGIAPTHREIAIDVVDIVRLEDGRYVEHWGINTLSSVLADLNTP